MPTPEPTPLTAADRAAIAARHFTELTGWIVYSEGPRVVIRLSPERSDYAAEAIHALQGRPEV